MSDDYDRADRHTMQIAELMEQRDELLTICKVLARYKSGPRPSDRAAWIGTMLDLAEQAREVLAKIKAT